MQRTDAGDVQRGSLFEQGLHLRAVLADNVRIIAPRLVHPAVVKGEFVRKEIAGQRAEGAERIGGEERALGDIEGNHGLGPVYHGRHMEGKGMPSRAERIAFGNGNCAIVHGRAEKLREHDVGFAVAHDFDGGVAQNQLLDAGAVVRLHVVDNEVVEAAPGQRMGEIFVKLAADRTIHRVHQDGLFVQHQIGIVRNAVVQREHVFKQAEPPVRRADINGIPGDLSLAVHGVHPPIQNFVKQL